MAKQLLGEDSESTVLLKLLPAPDCSQQPKPTSIFRAAQPSSEHSSPGVDGHGHRRFSSPAHEVSAASFHPCH